MIKGHDRHLFIVSYTFAIIVLNDVAQILMHECDGKAKQKSWQSETNGIVQFYI